MRRSPLPPPPPAPARFLPRPLGSDAARSSETPAISASGLPGAGASIPCGRNHDDGISRPANLCILRRFAARIRPALLVFCRICRRASGFHAKRKNAITRTTVAGHGGPNPDDACCGAKLMGFLRSSTRSQAALWPAVSVRAVVHTASQGALYVPASPSKPNMRAGRGRPEEARPPRRPLIGDLPRFRHRHPRPPTPWRATGITERCAACHDWSKSGPNKIGPNLYGVVGRPRASHARLRLFRCHESQGRQLELCRSVHILAPARRVRARNQDELRRAPARPGAAERASPSCACRPDSPPRRYPAAVLAPAAGHLGSQPLPGPAASRNTIIKGVHGPLISRFVFSPLMAPAKPMFQNEFGAAEPLA